jgi:hypothetical protein
LRLGEGGVTSNRGLRGILVQDNLLSVSLKNADLENALKEISRKCNLEIRIEAPLEEKVTMEFAGLPLEKGLQKLLKNQSYMFMYGDQREPGGLESVRIMGKGERRQPAAGRSLLRPYRNRPARDVRPDSSGRENAADLPEPAASGSALSAEALERILSRYSRDGEEALEDFMEDMEGDPDKIRPRLMKALEDAREGGAAEMEALKALLEEVHQDGED